MIGDSDLAVLVRALAFQLIGPDGAVAGELLSATDAALFPAPLPATYNGLEMYHRDAATTDSSLRWTYGDAGNETVQLTGPAAVGAATANRPRVSLSRESGLPRTIAKIAAGQNTGGALVTEAAVTMESRPGPTYLTVIEAGQTVFGLRDDGLVNRLATVGDIELWASTAVINKGFTGNEGRIYGVSHHHAAAPATVGLGVAPQVAATIVLPNLPVAGILDLSWNVYLNQTVAGTAGAFAYVLLDGVQIPVASAPVQVWSDVVQLESKCSRAVGIGLAAGNHQLDLVLTKGAVGGAAAWQISNTSLDAVLYR